MFCKNCGTELKQNEKFCTNCGAKIEEDPFEQSTGSDGNTYNTANGGYNQGYNQGYNGYNNGGNFNGGYNGNNGYNNGNNGYNGYNGNNGYNGYNKGYNQPQEIDAPNIGFAFLGFFFPIVGFILWLVWKDQFPLKAKSCGKGALISIIVNAVFVVLYIILIVAVIGTSVSSQPQYLLSYLLNLL